MLAVRVCGQEVEMECGSRCSAFVLATALLALLAMPAIAQDSTACAKAPGLWTTTEGVFGLTNEFLINSDGTASYHDGFFNRKTTWTCTGNVVVVPYIFRMTLSADGNQMSGTGGAINVWPYSAVRKSAPPATQAEMGASIAKTWDETERLLAPPQNFSPRGIYKLDLDYDFNVLDAVYYDAETRQISLIGHRDERFARLRIPYLHHLATLLETTKPEFTLKPTPDTERRLDGVFRSLTLSPQRQIEIGKQLGDVMDTAGRVTRVGRYMLPAFDVYPVEGNRAPGYFGVDTTLTADSRVLVTRVAPNSPAAQAGVAVGDQMAFFNGRSPYFPAELTRLVRFAGAGNTVKFAYFRNRQLINETVTLTADPNPDPWFGFERPDVIAALYRAAGNEAAARVVYAFGLANAKNPQTFTVAMNLFTSVNLADEFSAHYNADNAGTPEAEARGVRLGRTFAERLDDIFGFRANSVRGAYDGNLARTRDASLAIKAAFNQVDVLLEPKIGELLDRALDRPEGIQIAPELVETIFQFRPESVPDYLGVPPSSLLARAMFEADFLTKRLVARPDLKLKIRAYQTEFEFGQKNPQFRHTESSRRYWISVGRLDAAQSPAGDTLAFDDVRMRINIREVGKDGADRPRRPGGYEDLLTSLYDDFAQEYPALHELREAAKLSAAATWIRQKTPSVRLPREGAVVWRGPDKVPGLMFLYLSPRRDDKILTLIVTGGISFFDDSSVVDLRGTAAGGAGPLAPKTPGDPTVRLLRGNPLTAVPANAQSGWVARPSAGPGALQSVSLIIDPGRAPTVASAGSAGSTIFGAAPVRNPDLGPAAQNTARPVSGAMNQLSSASQSGQSAQAAAADRNTPVEIARALSNCQFDTTACAEATPVVTPTVQTPTGAFPNAFAARLATDPRYNDAQIQQYLAFYLKSEREAAAKRRELAAIEKDLASGQGNLEILNAQKGTLENNIKNDEANTAKAESWIKDRVVNLGLPMPEEAAPMSTGSRTATDSARQ